VNSELLHQYDRIYCLSTSFARKLMQKGFNCEILQGASSQKRFYVAEHKYDILFVGNNRLNGIRRIVQDVGHTPYKFKVWGRGWQGKIDPQYIGGQFIDYTNLNEYYASARISLNDHNESMRQEGFIVIPRIFDVLASGGFCISDKNHGISEILQDTVPQYESPAHLKELIDYYINSPTKRQEKIDAAQDIVSQFKWDKLARKIVGGLPESYQIRHQPAWI
jgi:spore maturation protein CgeB